MQPILTILISFFVSVTVAYATAKASSYSKDIVAERQGWREIIRLLTMEAVHLIRSEKTHTDEFKNIMSEFRVRLNPDDEYDNEIIGTLQKSITVREEFMAQKLLAQVSRLLKHDWERAKAESRLFGIFESKKANIRFLKSTDYM